MLTFAKGLSLLQKYNLSENIIRHCKAVANTCRLVSERLKQKYPNLDVNLIELSGLLHDIGRCRTHSWEHAYESGKILRDEGLDEIASIVEVHGELARDDKTIDDFNIYQLILIYSDATTEYERMPIQERLKGVFERRMSSGDVDEAKRLPQLLEKEKLLVNRIESQMSEPMPKL